MTYVVVHISLVASIALNVACAGVVKLLAPNLRPKQDTHLSITWKPDRDLSVYKITMVPDPNIVHHMIIRGCKEPAVNAPFFNTNGLNPDSIVDTIPTGSYSCKGGISKTMASWPFNEDGFNLTYPEGSGFHVGPGTLTKWVVLQLHYKHPELVPSEGDTSGMWLHTVEGLASKRAGVLLVSSMKATLPAGKISNVDLACEMKAKDTIIPFKYIVHTHYNGLVVSGWRVRNKNEWTLIGKGINFRDNNVPIAENLQIKQGDYIAVRCQQNLTHMHHDVHMGSYEHHEMCFFFVYYYAEENTEEPRVKQTYCKGEGPPRNEWKEAGFENIPEFDSTHMGTITDYLM